MRVFIAIELDDEIKDYIYEKQNIIRDKSKGGNFAIRDNFHLTLRFIGEVKDENIEKIKNAIDKTVKNKEKFLLKLGRIGYFSKGTKKIIWIGIGSGLDDLQGLFKNLEEKLENVGFEKEPRGLTPHITIGREIRLIDSFESLSKSINIEDKELLVNKISLMESARVDGVLKYNPIYIKEFKKD